jgi:hypothetical protein
MLVKLVLFKSRENIKCKSIILHKSHKYLLINKFSSFMDHVHYYAMCTRVARSLLPWQEIVAAGLRHQLINQSALSMT